MSELKFKITETFTNELEREWVYLSKLNDISLFQTFHWQFLWYDKIQKNLPDNSVIIISIYFKNKIIGIIPLEKKKKKFNINILTLTGSPFADYCDCLLDLDF